MAPQFLVIGSAVIIGLLGCGHLLLTLKGPKLLPRDRTLRSSMDSSHLVITEQTTVWRAWLGFNVSHAIGALLFGLVFGYLALAHRDLLFDSIFLQALGIATLVVYVTLARLYWFITPLVGSSLSLVLFVGGVVLSQLGGTG